MLPRGSYPGTHVAGSQKRPARDYQTVSHTPAHTPQHKSTWDCSCTTTLPPTQTLPAACTTLQTTFSIGLGPQKRGFQKDQKVRGHGVAVVGQAGVGTRGRGGGVGTRPRYSVVCLLAAPIGLSPLLILTLCGSERVLVVSTEPPDDLSCLTTPGVGCPGDGAVARAIDQVHPDAHSESTPGLPTPALTRGGGGTLLPNNVGDRPAQRRQSARGGSTNPPPPQRTPPRQRACTAPAHLLIECKRHSDFARGLRWTSLTTEREDMGGARAMAAGMCRGPGSGTVVLLPTGAAPAPSASLPRRRRRCCTFSHSHDREKFGGCCPPHMMRVV